MKRIKDAQVGDTVHLLRNNRYRADQMVEIARIGRKYLYVSYPGRSDELALRFDRATGVEDSHIGVAAMVCTEDEYQERARRLAVKERLRSLGLAWDAYVRVEYSTDKLERVAEILEADCLFHGRPYAEHDFAYGPQCRRCGMEAE